LYLSPSFIKAEEKVAHKLQKKPMLRCLEVQIATTAAQLAKIFFKRRDIYGVFGHANFQQTRDLLIYIYIYIYMRNA
jgi:hypothetical protein